MRYLLIPIFMFGIATTSFAKTIFSGGIRSDLNINNFVTDLPMGAPAIEETYFANEIRAYAGFTSSTFIGFNQLTFSLLPGVNIIQTPELGVAHSASTTANFFFHEAYFRFDGLSASFNIGKTLLGWGVGSTRQFSFIRTKALEEGLEYFYNSEILYRKDSTLLSIGFAADTESIDAYEQPKWYTPWISAKYDNIDYTLFSILMADHNIDTGTDLKGAFEFQYFLPHDFEIYSTLAYYLLQDDKIGLEDQIEFLAGLKYEYRYDNNILFVPQIEYTWEQYDNFMLVGFTTLIYQVDLIFHTIFTYTQEKTLDTTLRTILTWNANKNFKTSFEYYAFFLEDPAMISLEHLAIIKFQVSF